jgi:hypothetical protein
MPGMISIADTVRMLIGESWCHPSSTVVHGAPARQPVALSVLALWATAMSIGYSWLPGLVARQANQLCSRPTEKNFPLMLQPWDRSGRVFFSGPY